jgi:hypothetical protein
MVLEGAEAAPDAGSTRVPHDGQKAAPVVNAAPQLVQKACCMDGFSLCEKALP